MVPMMSQVKFSTDIGVFLNAVAVTLLLAHFFRLASRVMRAPRETGTELYQNLALGIESKYFLVSTNVVPNVASEVLFTWI
jgi:hypothetical protein